MKTFLQFANEAVQSPTEKPAEKPPRKIAGHTFAEEQDQKPKRKDLRRLARDNRRIMRQASIRGEQRLGSEAAPGQTEKR